MDALSTVSRSSGRAEPVGELADQARATGAGGHSLTVAAYVAYAAAQR
jgi:hypothetical protein